MSIRSNVVKRQCSSVWNTALANFESWMHSPKTAVLLVFLIALCFIEVRGTVERLDALNARVYWNEMVFNQLSYGSNILISTALFFSVMSEVPRRISVQNLILIRSTKARWMTGQMLYMLMLVLAFWLCICTGSVIFSIDQLQPGFGWSDTARITSGVIAEEDAFVPAVMRDYFTPIKAILLASLPLLLFWYSILITIFLFSIFHYPNLGVVFCAINVYSVMTVGIINIDPKWFCINYSTLASIFGYDYSIYKIWNVLIVYMIYLLVITVLAYTYIRNKDVGFNTCYEG